MRKLLWRKHCTQKTAFRQGQTDSPNCPLCNKLDEPFHFLRCSVVRSHSKHTAQYVQLKQKMAALDISAMMWHIITGYIEGGQLPLAGEEDLNRDLLLIYETQNAIEFQNFLFGRLLTDFFPVAQYLKENFERSSYPKIWVHIIQYVCEVWRIRGDLVSTKLKQTKKFELLREVDCLLDSNDISYITSGDKSLLTKSPDRTWPVCRIQSWMTSLKSFIDIGKRFA